MWVVFSIGLLLFAASNCALSNVSPEVMDILISKLAENLKRERIPAVALSIVNDENIGTGPSGMSILRMFKSAPQGMHAKIRLNGSIHLNLNRAQHCREWCEVNSVKCKADILFLVYLPKSLYADPYELNCRHDFGWPHFNIHQTSWNREHFDPEAFAEDSHSSYLGLELLNINIVKESCQIKFDITIPVHVRYQARLLQSTPSRRSSIFSENNHMQDDTIGNIDDDNTAARSLLTKSKEPEDLEEELLHSLLGAVSDTGMHKPVDFGDEDLFVKDRQHWFNDVFDNQHVASLIPPPLVALRRTPPEYDERLGVHSADIRDSSSPHNTYGTNTTMPYSRTLVLASEKCIPCLARGSGTGAGATSTSVSISCSHIDFNGGCTPMLELRVPVALESHVAIVVWTTTGVLICTTYLLSWLLLHPKRRGASALGIHAPTHQSFD